MDKDEMNEDQNNLEQLVEALVNEVKSGTIESDSATALCALNW